MEQSMLDNSTFLPLSKEQKNLKPTLYQAVCLSGIVGQNLLSKERRIYEQWSIKVWYRSQQKEWDSSLSHKDGVSLHRAPGSQQDDIVNHWTVISLGNL